MNRFFTLLLLIFSIGANAQNRGIVKGVVTDASTMRPVPFAQVIVYGTSAATQTDSLGVYVINSCPAGFQRLQFASVGYKDFITEPVQITAAIETTIDALLQPIKSDIDAVVVSARSQRPIAAPPLSTFRLTTQDIEKSPGGNRDISKVVQNIPGVSATPAYRNDLVVRGGSPSENRFMLDGIEIPVINHFATQGSSGGNASIINSDFIRSATLYTSGFPMSAGGVLSSVLDMRMGEANTERFKGKLALGASDFGVTLSSPLGKKANIMASYRISYLQLLFKVIGLPFLPTYNDAQLKFSYHITPKDHLYIIGVGAYDFSRLNLELNSSASATPSQRNILEYLPENDQWNYAVGAVYNHKTENGDLRVVISTNALDNSLQKWQDNDPEKGKNLDYKSRETEYKTRVEYSSELGSGFAIDGGLGFKRGFYTNNTYQKLFIDNAPVTSRYSAKLALSTYSGWVAIDKLFWGDKLRLTLSAQIEGNDYWAGTSNPIENISPRFAVSYAFAPKWRFNAAVGRYSQSPSFTTMGYQNSEGERVNQNSLKYIMSNQVSAGFSFAPTPLSKLSVEGFYKDYSNYPMSLIDSVAIGGQPYQVFAVGAEPVRSIGRGRAYGVEVLYRNSDLWGFRLNASYTFYRSEFRKLDRNFEPTGPYVPSNWDNQHLMTIVLSRNLGRGWEAGLRWRFAGGAPYTPYNEKASMKKEQWDATHQPVMDYSLQNTGRLPAFHQLDLRVDKTWFFKRWTLGFYVDVQNAYNYDAVGQELLLPQVDPTTGSYIVGPDGNYVAKYYPNSLGGTIIPTLGVIIEF